MDVNGEPQIGCNADSDRDEVVGNTANRDRWAAAISAVLQRKAVVTRPAQERPEQDDGAKIAIRKQMPCRPKLGTSQHRVLHRHEDAPTEPPMPRSVGGDRAARFAL